MEMETRSVAIEPLSQSSLTLADSAEDIRDRTVYDRNGNEIGHVKDLMIDTEESKVRFLELASGGFLGIGEDTFLIPVDAITAIDDDGVRIDQTHEHVAGGPRYQPDLVEDTVYYNDVYGYYGYSPYWGPGYSYPAYPYYGRR